MANNVKGKIIVNFTEATSRQSLETGEQLPTIIGKIKKFFTDLKTVAFTGSYTDLSNTPTIPTKVSQLTNDSGFTKTVVDSALSSTSTNPVQNKVINTALAGKAASSHTHTKSQITDFPSSLPANGGNSATVNGKTVATNVPANAVFTDTISKIYYAECSDAWNVIAKTVTCDGFVLETGAIIAIRFTATDNTAPSSGNISLNVNGTGTKNIVTSNNATVILNYSYSWAFRSNLVHLFMYNGTYFVLLNWDDNNTYTPMGLGFGYGTCATAEATTAKVATLASYVLVKNGIVAIKFTYAVPANATLNINSKGAKNIFYRGAKIVANIIKAGDIATFIYDGTQYQLLAVDRDNNTTYSVASTTANGLMSAADKAKLDGIAEGASKASSTSYQTIQQMTEF